MLCNQAHLICKNRHMTTWIPSYIKEGQEIRLKNEEKFWTVKEVYWPTLEKGEINHGWKVGGL